MSKVVKTVIIVLLVAVVGIGVYFLINAQINAQRTRTFNEFLELSDGDPETGEGDEIVRIEISGYNLYGYTTTSGGSYSYSSVGPSQFDSSSPYLQKWIENGIVIEFNDPNAGSGWGNFLYIAVLVVGVVAFFLILRSMSGGGGKVMNFGKTKARVSTNLKVRFSDVAGAEEEIGRASCRERV